MHIGTKSLLFGAHQFLMHPVLAWVAWRRLYGKTPTFRQTIAIVIHDWGYWGSPNMDGEEGERHPVWAYKWCLKRGWLAEADLCLFHSRFYAKAEGRVPSELCYADKLANAMVPARLYVFLTVASGELFEYLSAKKHESVRFSRNPHEFVLRFRGVVRKVLQESWHPGPRIYANNKWKIPHTPCADKLNA